MANLKFVALIVAEISTFIRTTTGTVKSTYNMDM